MLYYLLPAYFVIECMRGVLCGVLHYWLFGEHSAFFTVGVSL
ncbi:hypothetical protein APHCRT_0068 [Anaplasma phagocytophilum str. CRT53-1]|uniref:Uncharacterized protein n=1 Tax=Anaplasma phagocytophilum str. CRT53-1 TaxID=1359157 RepID=A0A0F3Q8Q5_ANAPH|nr:hypothetical protein APHCRT_0068 [Anaplasma phagocytophilum str. CRT53-1]